MPQECCFHQTQGLKELLAFLPLSWTPGLEGCKRGRVKFETDRSRSSPLHMCGSRICCNRVYRRCQNYRTELGVQKYGKISYLLTSPDLYSGEIRILFYN